MDKRQSSVGDHLIKTKSKESKQKADVSKGHKCLNVDLGEDTLLSICDTFLEILDDVQVNSNLLLQKLYDVHISLKSKLLTVKGINEENTDNLPFENTDLLKTFSSSSWSINSGASGLMEDYSDFKKFMTEVICPFCSKSQTGKINFIKHLDKSCTPSLNDEFQERRVIPFSAFQILPNNTIKCNVCFNSVSRNIKSFFAHMLTKNHTLNFKKAKKLKDYTDFLFCSVCKVLVPDTYTQLNFHMKSEVHRSRSAEAPNYSKSSGCVYMKNKKFKCLECPGKNIYHNSKDILQHFEDPKHKKHMKEGFPVIFCEVCDEIIHVFKLVIHFSSKEHAAREKALPLENSYELCFYCGFSCSTLKELSQHMKVQCSVIFSMRLKDPEMTTKSEVRNNKVTEEANLKEPVSSRNSYVSVEIKKEQVASENLSKEENSRESSHVIVKDNTDVVGVYQFFEKFGEITEVQIYKEKNLLIRFREKCAVDSVLRLRDKILIKGVKVDITTEEELNKPPKKAEKSKNKDLFQTVNMPIEPSIYSEDEEEKLKELFNRVSTHLSTTKKT